MKKFFVIILMVYAVLGIAQPSTGGGLSKFYNAKNTYSYANLLAATATVDTVTNAGAGAVYSKAQMGDGYITIQATVTKVSGTVVGTVTLEGSLDGLLYTPIKTEETQTALATATLTDASNTYIWRLKKSPYIFYKIGTAGGTTCVYYLSGYILKRGLGN